MGKPYPSYQPTRCTAHSKRTGDPCGNWAIRGGTVCRKHGGAVKATKEAAARRILAAADPAAALLVSQMYDKGLDASVRQRAALALLDRAGLNAKSELTVELKPYEAIIERIIVDVPDDLPALPSGPDVIPADELEMFDDWERPAPRPGDDDEDEEPDDEPTETTAVQVAPKVEYVDPASFSEKPPARLDPDGLTRRPAPRRRDA
jgi:hypothetical protein